MLSTLVELAAKNDKLSERVQIVEAEIENMTKDLHASTVLTALIAEDTATLRALRIEGAATVSLFCRLAKWSRFLFRKVARPSLPSAPPSEWRLT